jgi:hypothetical protein
MKRISSSLALVAAFFFLPACHDKSPTEPMPQPSGDSVVIAAITPATTTVVAPGQTIDFAAVLSYRLDSAADGRLLLSVRDQANRSLLPPATPNMFNITRGTNRLNVAYPVPVPASGVTKVIVKLEMFPGAATAASAGVQVEYDVR